jgi:DNA repair photolyase
MATSPILRPGPTTLRRRVSRPKHTSLTLFPLAARHGDCEPDGLAPKPSPEPDRRGGLATELVGIARLAASSPRAEAKRGTEYFLLPVRSILNECHSERVPFRWTVNPYRGCEFGCRYCYARYTHEFMEIDGGEFEKKIYVKKDAGPLVERDLSSEKIWGEHIAIGTATDPYQPAEKEFAVTRTILERMLEREGLSLSITTKSDRVVRDIDLLQEIAKRSSISVNFSITTVKTRLARLLEPRAPRPDLRFEALHKLREAGIAAGVLGMPILPGITDAEEDLDALARNARDAGAQWFATNVLFLMPASLKQFLPFLKQKFPNLLERYEKWYGRYGNAPDSYRQEIAARVEKLRKKYDLGTRPERGGKRWSSPQLALTLETGGDTCRT